MQINLKQVEIVQAIKDHISAKGFSLVGKDVTVVFTAGRKDSGTSADVTIEDAAITLLPNLNEAPEAPKLTVVKSEAAPAPVVAGTVVITDATLPAATPAAAATQPGASLFGS